MERTVIVGVAESDLGIVPEGTHAGDLMGQAVIRAAEDAGISLSDIDGLFASTTELTMPALTVAEYLGLDLRYIDGTQIGGSSFMAHLNHARGAISAGLCDVAVVTHGSTQRSVGRSKASPQEYPPYEAPYRPVNPVSAYSLAASRYLHQFGASREHLAEVAVSAREWAKLNPKAFKREDLTVEEVLSAPMVSSPLGVRDCCLVTDGGAAAIVMSESRAKSLGLKPIYILGVAEMASHRFVSNMPDITTTGATISGKRAFAEAGLSPSDIDVAELYDAFTITTLLFLEDLGFCKKGEAAEFVKEGNIRPGGSLPVNTNGGGLSYCHPGMYGLLLIVEATRQLRGECGDRQVSGAEVALAHGNGGVLSSQCTVILGTEPTR